jgi:putative spermidine/putrescine transport system ATP-binding protein
MLARADGIVDAGQHAVRGTVREVVYVGMSTRYVVDLEVGGTLMAVRQNSEELTDTSGMRGVPVLLTWDTSHEYRVAD